MVARHQEFEQIIDVFCVTEELEQFYIFCWTVTFSAWKSCTCITLGIFATEVGFFLYRAAPVMEGLVLLFSADTCQQKLTVKRMMFLAKTFWLFYIPVLLGSLCCCSVDPRCKCIYTLGVNVCLWLQIFVHDCLWWWQACKVLPTLCENVQVNVAVT